ncbi:polysaccharide pyruvyl transferase family protein [Mesorhizobium sp. M0208]
MDFLRAVRHIRKAKVIVVPGTGILDYFGDRPLGMPFDVFKWCLAAHLAGTRIAFVSVGAGPVGHRLSRWLITSAARMADYRSYRDTASREFMASVGVDTSRESMDPDLAFTLPVPQSANADPSHPLTVGVGVMNYRGWCGFEERGLGISESYLPK